jgi:hypothetical protein
LFASQEEAHLLMQELRRLKTALMKQSGEFYLAKGELSGMSHPLFRSRSQVLKGIGFNYDFADAESAARDLRTGEIFDGSKKRTPLSLLQIGDLLVTTGLDGVFPSGFRVGIVSKVETLHEGASSYEIEAMPAAGNLDDLSQVFVLPPLKD